MSIPAYDEDVVAVGSLRKTALAIADIVTIVGSDGVHWADLVEESTALPYGTITSLAGGWEHETDADAVDKDMKLVIFTADKLVAVAARKALGKLDGAVLDVSDYPNTEAYGYIQKTSNFYKRDVGQNKPIFEVGGYFRLRFIVPKEI